MKTSNLHDVWASPDNSRVTPKQFSLRLPVHIAAKVAALCEMYPQKNRTQIIADLLTSALDELEKALPEAPGDKIEEDFNDDIAVQLGRAGEQLYYMGGVRARFRRLANEHYHSLEGELGNKDAEPLFGNIVGTEADFKK